jgi:hypothetical protein
MSYQIRFVIAVMVLALSGCSNWISTSPVPTQIAGQVSCAPTYPGWYVYNGACYPVGAFYGTYWR